MTGESGCEGYGDTCGVVRCREVQTWGRKMQRWGLRGRVCIDEQEGCRAGLRGQADDLRGEGLARRRDAGTLAGHGRRSHARVLHKDGRARGLAGLEQGGVG